MIFILTRNSEVSSSNVIKWLDYYRADYERVNFSDYFNKGVDISLQLTKDGPVVRLGDSAYTDEDIKNSIIWHRKGDRPDFSNKSFGAIMTHVKAEYMAFVQSFVSVFDNAKWLCRYEFRELNKLHVLTRAYRYGLLVPDTIITNKKRYIESVCENGAITKCIEDGLSVELPDKQVYLLSTNKLDKEHLKDLPEKFFPSTVQSYIDKQYELRIFFIGKKFFSTAIFSQKHKLTEVDFRLSVAGNVSCRMVPYTLPKDIEDKLGNLMDSIGLNTGSIDMIVNKNGEYVFLEVNPYGQYGWVSASCNYPIDKEIADYLIENQNKKQS